MPHRDDFFALNHTSFAAARALAASYQASTLGSEDIVTLARLGIAEIEGRDLERAYSGPSLIGEFPELPSVSDPLVVNCFSTAWCPLLCRYCHADDLMGPAHRAAETDRDLDNVIATAHAVPALVAVITGGDPLTRPRRATRLVEGLARSKALVLDTSGVGDIRHLLSCLQEHAVHVRVSIDSALPSVNDRARPVNPAVVPRGESAWHSAVSTVEQLLAAGVHVSVQSVITADTDRIEEWRALRGRLISWGVKHWVMHVVVSGGKARRVEQRALRQKRPRQLRPSADVGAKLAAFTKETVDADLPIDIRCTDTDDRPNSVLLVSSTGDLYTEGYAKNGKVLLFEAASGRADATGSLMIHLDRFGHARRYLNWNPWSAASGQSIEDLCIPFKSQPNGVEAVVETEFKLRVDDEVGLRQWLRRNHYARRRSVLQRDEYFDTAGGAAADGDYVVRLRTLDGGVPEVAFKGPRFYTADGASSRLEFEVPVESLESARAALSRRGLLRTWYLEKIRSEYVRKTDKTMVLVDQLPTLGLFLELEGALDSVRAIRNKLASVGSVERRNYREFAVDEAIRAGGVTLEGLEFNTVSVQPEPPSPRRNKRSARRVAVAR